MGSPEPEETLDLLRALARRAPASPHPDGASPASAEKDDAKLEALRALAERLDRQLRSAAPTGSAPAPPVVPRRPPPAPPRSAPQTTRRGWGEFQAALPDAASLVPRFDRTRIIFVLIAGAVLAAAAVGGLVGHRNPAARAPAADQSVAVPPQLVPPVGQVTPQTDASAVNKAMSECDAAAAQDPNALYFLILPLVPSKPSDHDWRSVALQTVGDAFLLLSAKDALDGMRNGSLGPRPGRYTFSILDTGSGATYSWTSATGMSRLARKDSGAVKSLKLGFDFSATQAGAQWTAEFKRDPGTCYWVSVLVRE